MSYYNRSNRKPKVGTPRQRSKAAMFLREVRQRFGSIHTTVRREYRKAGVAVLCEAWNVIEANHGVEMDINASQLLLNDERSIGKRLAYSLHIRDENQRYCERMQAEADAYAPSGRGRGDREDFHADC